MNGLGQTHIRHLIVSVFDFLSDGDSKLDSWQVLSRRRGFRVGLMVMLSIVMF